MTVLFSGTVPSATTPTDLPAGWTYTAGSPNSTSVTFTHNQGTFLKSVNFLSQNTSASPSQWRFRVPSTTAISFVPEASGNPSSTSISVDLNPTLTGVGSGQLCKVIMYF